MTSELDKLSKFIEQSPKDKYKFDGKADTDKVEVCRDRGECVELSIQSAKMVDFMNVGYGIRRVLRLIRL